MLRILLLALAWGCSMPAPAIMIPQTWGQRAALSDRSLAQGASAAWHVGILPPNGYGIRTGLEAHWRLDDDTGATQALDSGPYARHLTTLTNVGWADGVSGRCLSFVDRAVVRAAYGAAIDFSAKTALTIVFSVSKTAATGAGSPYVLCFGEASVSGMAITCTSGTENIRLWFGRAGFNEYIPLTSIPFDPVLGIFAVTFDLATKHWIIYKHGLSAGNGDLTNLPVMPNKPLVVGNYFTPDKTLNHIGLIDEIYLWSRVLSPAEIAALAYAPDGYIDYSSMLVNNQVSIGAEGSVLKPSKAAQAQFSFRNSALTFMQGDLRGAGVRIRQAIKNVTDLMDYGDCESAGQGPMMLGDTGSNDTATATLHQDTTDAYRGVACYRFTKLNAAGTSGVANLYGADSMHGCISSGKVTVSFKIKIPTAEIANWNGKQIFIYFQEYYAAAWHGTAFLYVGTASENVWRTVTGTMTLNAGTSKTSLFLISQSTVAINATLLVDDIKYSCSYPWDTTLPVRQWTRMFTGYVSPEGCQRRNGSLTTSDVVLSCFDPAKKLGMNKKCKNQAVLNYKICDPADIPHSILHLLTGQMGLGTVDLDVDSLTAVKDYIGWDGSLKIWPLLQNMALCHGALLGFGGDGRMRFKLWTAADWAAATPEYTFDENNIWKGWTAKGSEVSCNDAKMNFSEYEALPAGSIIFKSYENWDETTGLNAILLHAGEYWPVAGDAQAVAQLQYQYGQEKYPIGTAIITPTIGALGSGSDIECTGGVVTLVSFNGSTADTVQNVGSSEIILHNATAGDVVMVKLELRGTPIRELKKILVETVTATDGSTPDDADIVEEEIPGDFATDVARAKVTTLRWVDFGHLPRGVYEFDADFTPQLQAGAIARFHPDASTDVTGVVIGYAHETSGPWSALSKTHVQMVERIAFNATGSGKVRAWSSATPRTGVDPAHSAYICVGAPGATGRFDMVAPAAGAEITIQAAVDRIAALGGGTVELVGTFYTNDQVLISTSDIVLKMDQAAIIKDSSTPAIFIHGPAIGLHITNVKVLGGTIAKDVGDVANVSLLQAQYADNTVIRDVVLIGSAAQGLDVLDSANVTVDHVTVKDWNGLNNGNIYAIGVDEDVTGQIINCVIDGILTAHTNAGDMIGLSTLSANLSLRGNRVEQMRTEGTANGIVIWHSGGNVSDNVVSDNEGDDSAFGIRLVNLGVDTENCTIKNNRVEKTKCVSDSSLGIGIYVEGNCNYIDGNHCLNNGDDLDYTNVNGCNFHDDGIGTIVGSNSWT
jgi:hypothetical protein